MKEQRKPLFPREGKGCPSCGAHNIMHYSWCTIHLGEHQ